MTEPLETVIIRAQQNFEVVGGLNPIEITISGDRIINILKKYKNVVYKIIPLGLLFPATIKNDTRNICSSEKFKWSKKMHILIIRHLILLE